MQHKLMTSVPIMYTEKKIPKAKVITVVKIKTVIFWDEMLCSLIKGYHRAPRCPHS